MLWTRGKSKERVVAASEGGREGLSCILEVVGFGEGLLFFFWKWEGRWSAVYGEKQDCGEERKTPTPGQANTKHNTKKKCAQKFFSGQFW